MSDRWTDRLSEYLDDELGPEERRELAEHLAGCAACAAALVELRRVADRAAALGDRPPAADLWPGVAARIRGQESRREAEGGAQTEIRPRPLSEPPRRLPVFSFTLPQLAAAGLAVALASAALVYAFSLGFERVFRGPDPAGEPPAVSAVSPADSHQDTSYDAAIGELRGALAEGRAQLDSSTVRVLEQNLALIEESIDQSRRALAADPGNPYLREHLQETMRRKLELLQRATLVASAR